MTSSKVHYSSSRDVTLESDQKVTLRPPGLARLTVAATPSNCRVTIDKGEPRFVPFTLEIAVGVTGADRGVGEGIALALAGAGALAVAAFADRVGVEDARYLAVAISIQAGTGGNLAYVLEALAQGDQAA